LTFSIHDCDTCVASSGSIVNSLNVILLIVLIVIAFWIEAPDKPVCACCGSSRPTEEGAPTPEQVGILTKPVVGVAGLSPSSTTVLPSTTRSEMVTPEGKKLIREVTTYPDGRQEITETETEEEPGMMLATNPTWNATATRSPPDETFIVLQEMNTPAGTRKTVETTTHTDGRHEVVETVEEPSMIGHPVHSEEHARMYHHDDDEEEGRSSVVQEVRRTRGQMRLSTGNIKIVEEVEYSDGTTKVFETFEDPSMIPLHGNNNAPPTNNDP
jgi:hypothetical protein